MYYYNLNGKGCHFFMANPEQPVDNAKIYYNCESRNPQTDLIGGIKNLPNVVRSFVKEEDKDKKPDDEEYGECCPDDVMAEEQQCSKYMKKHFQKKLRKKGFLYLCKQLWFRKSLFGFK